MESGHTSNMSDILHITMIPLRGLSNYLSWSQSVRRVLITRDLLSHVIKIPPSIDEEDEAYHLWVQNDNMVIIWLINSMEEHVANNVIHLETTMDIWDICAKLYLSIASLQRVYDVLQSMLHTKHGDNIHEFSSGFWGLLQEWKIAQPYSTDIAVQERQREALAVTICLSNIKPYLKFAKTQLLSSSTLPSIDDISATLLLIPDPSPPFPIDALSAMFCDNRGTSSSYRGRGRNMRGGRTMKGVANRGGRTGPNNFRTEPRLCTHYGGQNHLMEICWKLHGKPDWATTDPVSVNVEKREEKADSQFGNVTLTAKDYVAF
ncbi:uncharacterized protein [Aristolochia californica]|uniref:uncharacterized protein n=1 Tax=Aristolochia californica TaxID=171875 RepID=UPI0035D81986